MGRRQSGSKGHLVPSPLLRAFPVIRQFSSLRSWSQAKEQHALINRVLPFKQNLFSISEPTNNVTTKYKYYIVNLENTCASLLNVKESKKPSSRLPEGLMKLVIFDKLVQKSILLLLVNPVTPRINIMGNVVL